MQSKRVKVVSVILALTLVTTLVPAADCAPQKVKTPTLTQITVTDLAGRKVSLNIPVERVVLACARDMRVFVALLGKDAFQRVVGWGSDLKTFDYDTYLKYRERFPQVENISEIGYHSKETFSVEKVISLKPDVVVFPLFIAELENAVEDISRLEQAGIPTIIIDYYKKPFENSSVSILLLGTILGKEKRAREIVDFCEEGINEVVSRLQKMDKPKPKVYLETGWKGPSEYGSTFGNISWGKVVVKAGGINIAEGIVPRIGPINPEYLVASNPDIIIITGSHWLEPPDAMRLGYYANPKESRQLLKAFSERPGWNMLNAVKNGRVYSIFHPFSHTHLLHFMGIRAFAKWLYPDEFKELDPEEDYKKFHKKFLPIDFSGVWTIGIRE